MEENNNLIENEAVEEQQIVPETEPSVSEEPVAEQPSDNNSAADYVEEIPTEPVHTEEPFGDFSSDGIKIEDEYRYPKVEIPLDDITETTPENKKGLRNFILILLAALVVSGVGYGGFWVGRGFGVTDNKVELNLESKPADTEMMNAAEVFAEVDKSVVGITVYNSTSTPASGSGVIYSSDGYIVTNDHIYDDIGAAKFIVHTYDGKEYDAEFVAGDVRSDLAVIKIKDKVDLTPAVFGDSSQLYVGEPVVAVGRPTGADTANNLTDGIVSLLNTRISNNSSYSVKAIQTNTAINPGSSGGGLFNMYGQVVGITSSKIAGSAYEGMGFAIPTTTVKRVVDSLIENGYVKDRAKLGISYQDYSSAIVEANGATRGLLVAEVSGESDLYGKISAGDTIVAINGIKIIDANIVLDVIDNAKPGDTVVFSVIRKNGGTADISAKLIADNGSSSYSERESAPKDDEEENVESMPEFTFPYGD